MCYVGKATKIFIFIVIVLAFIGLILGFTLIKHGVRKSHKCSESSSDSSCSPTIQQFPNPIPAPLISTTPNPNPNPDSNPSPYPPPNVNPTLSPPPNPNLYPPPSSGSGSGSSPVMTPPPPPPAPVMISPVVVPVPPPPADLPMPVISAPPPSLNPPSRIAIRTMNKSCTTATGPCTQTTHALSSCPSLVNPNSSLEFSGRTLPFVSDAVASNYPDSVVVNLVVIS
ncbi:proline-rich receptor-like protein kinase PERK2 [Chenopodium quinoa]|uniref:proline-rich receptor-like protein kinase PERK2 n=1 Tax=Chenopodium quinoa TaxID=63459 RepID=UPI000B776F5B|nr:proline-rich receptor-like protein kinase PERK2 [Chenopodium quinoa]